MDIRLLTLCLAAANLAVCHSCSTGKEFITTFLTNYQQSSGQHLLQLVLTAQKSEAKVHIQVASLKFSKKLTLSAGETQVISLPVKAELEKPFVNQGSAVQISSSTEIAVVSFNRRSYTGDGSVVSPVDNLGTDYIVYTPAQTSMDSLVGIVNGDSQNEITIIPASNLKLRNWVNWKKGEAVTVTLKPHDTYLMRGQASLTGTRIKSQKPVAVLAGHQCLSLGGKCEHVYEQLPPVAKMGHEYVVPVTGDHQHVKTSVVIITSEDNTKLTITSNSRTLEESIKTAGVSSILPLPYKRSAVIKSDKKVMVLLLNSNKPYDPFLVTLIPNCKMSTDWGVETLSDFSNTIAIVSEIEGANSVKVCAEGKCQSVQNWHKSDSKWAWAKVAMGKKQAHVTVKGEAQMAVYAYGGKTRHGYGVAGVCSLESTPPPPKDPCENVKCRPGVERCVDGVCVPTSTATCRATGDPHYATFDNRRYDFQGSCSYIMAKVAKPASDLTPFSVATKNNHRGNKRVSYVREVTVTVYDQVLTISSRRGKVQINGELVTLPLILLDGKIKVVRSGSYAVLTTNFGLVVKYDWNTKLYITVPSSYYEHMGGLCGNYNGDKKDDLPDPTDNRIPVVLQMIKKWKVADPDPFCTDNCGGSCPQCPLQQQAHFKNSDHCGLITKVDGPFAACHKTVFPSPYLEDCVYDVCINKGAKQILCGSMKTYFDACLSANVPLSAEWRTQSGCIPSCPAGSHYESCTSACPASCADLDSEKSCTEPCVEDCRCDDGLVFSGDRCVPVTQCGCQYQGKYYPAGSKFWGDSTCTSMCECKDRKVECKAVSCKNGEQCAVKKGIRDCYPTTYGSCQCSGDPHCRSLDNRRFDFMGTCTYVLTMLKPDSKQGMEPFQVLVTNENRGRRKGVSYTKSTSLIVFGNLNVTMSRTMPGKIMVNDKVTNLPYSSEDGKLAVHRQGGFGVVTTFFGLELRFNWKAFVKVILPGSYSGETVGLCGNFNGNKEDDFLKPDGTQTKNVNEFGGSWKVGEDVAGGCTSDCPGGKCPECEPTLIQQYKQNRHCGIISDKNGPFSQCHSVMDHTGPLDECVFDLCMYEGHVSALCSSLSAFSTSCQQAGAKVESWRKEDFCPLSCPANSHYEVCASPCQITCSLAIPESCDTTAPCEEGCECDNGFLLSNDKCVPVAECGCQDGGRYYEKGQVFFPGQSCDTRCVCSDGGHIQCDNKFKCSEHEECALKDGSLSCQPKSIGFCSMHGARTISSFDRQVYPLYGNCLFTLSAVEANSGGNPTYSVTLQQKTGEDGSVFRSVEIKVYDTEITMEVGVIWKVKVDGMTSSLPLSLEEGKVQVDQNGLHIIVKTNFGMKLTYDTEGSMILQIPSTYHSAPIGLCGNFNSNPSDDLLNGDPLATAAAWLIQNKNIKCEASCGAATCPKPDKDKIPEAQQACDIIKSTSGQLKGCASTVNPTPFYEACVTEMATHKGDKKLLCRHIQSYVTACQLAGAKIKEWRSDNFCPMKCPSGTHYDLCPSTSTSTCASLQSPVAPLACQEGCQCDGEMLFDGAACVSVERCGCFVEGRYYKSGTSVLSEDCSKSCSCQSGKVSCKANSCQEGEECRNKDGTIGCFPIDPCADVECRVKEHCEVSEGQGVCVPDSKALCWAFGDPHFITLDGMSYSFQGTCSYVFLKTTGLDSSLPDVSVIMKGELRGNSEGSFVHSIIVKMLGYTFLIPRGVENLVLVNGISEELPLYLEGGRISITKSGIRGKIVSDIGIEVTFDWSTLLMVTVSSSFFGNTGGLCGNYNGDRSDDMTTAEGNKAADVTTWASSWSIPDGDPFCFHHCEGECPQCSDEDRKKFTGPNYCGILSSKTGPFASCHATLPVQEFVEDCLYDVCTNEGRQEVLCDALSAYLVECQKANAPVGPWRELAGCPILCPKNSHYEECGTACPATCGHQPEVCSQGCEEGCFCDKGFVLSGKDCVIRETGCGCDYNGHYYKPDEEFWADSQCQEKCICDPVTQKAKCYPVGCELGERCSIVDGVQDCYPVSYKICTARGDPHFRSFDKLKYNFQGNCVYRLASVCKPRTGLKNFEITLENENRKNKRVSYAKRVTLKVYNVEFTLTRENKGKVLVDGLERTVPFRWNKTLVHVFDSNRHVTIQTHFLKLSYDFSNSVKLELASVYKGTVCGLCGNMNGDPADDLMLPNGKQAPSANDFGVSQWVADSEGCSHECKDCPPALPPGVAAPTFTKDCNIIVDQKGPLAQCIGLLDSQEFLEDCIYDMMLNNGEIEAACDIITDYVEQCQSAGGEVKEWRKKKFCPMKCPAKSEYSLKAPGCPITCRSRSPEAECKVLPSEGCVCKKGRLMSKDGCVKLAKCGCDFQGQYLEPGEGIFTEDACSTFCKCTRGSVACKKKPCQKGEECAVVKGVRGCYDKQELRKLKKEEKKEKRREEKEQKKEEKEKRKEEKEKERQEEKEKKKEEKEKRKEEKEKERQEEKEKKKEEKEQKKEEKKKRKEEKEKERQEEKEKKKEEKEKERQEEKEKKKEEKEQKKEEKEKKKEEKEKERQEEKEKKKEEKEQKKEEKKKRKEEKEKESQEEKEKKKEEKEKERQEEKEKKKEEKEQKKEEKEKKKEEKKQKKEEKEKKMD